MVINDFWKPKPLFHLQITKSLLSIVSSCLIVALHNNENNQCYILCDQVTKQFFSFPACCSIICFMRTHAEFNNVCFPLNHFNTFLQWFLSYIFSVSPLSHFNICQWSLQHILLVSPVMRTENHMGDFMVQICEWHIMTFKHNSLNRVKLNDCRRHEVREVESVCQK